MSKDNLKDTLNKLLEVVDEFSLDPKIEGLGLGYQYRDSSSSYKAMIFSLISQSLYKAKAADTELQQLKVELEQKNSELQSLTDKLILAQADLIKLQVKVIEESVDVKKESKRYWWQIRGY